MAINLQTTSPSTMYSDFTVLVDYTLKSGKVIMLIITFAELCGSLSKMLHLCSTTENWD